MDSECLIIFYVLNSWWNPKSSYILTCETHIMHLLCRVLKGSQMMNVRSWYIASVSLNGNHFIFVSKGLVHGKHSNKVWRSVAFILLQSRELVKGNMLGERNLQSIVRNTDWIVLRIPYEACCVFCCFESVKLKVTKFSSLFKMMLFWMFVLE